MTRLRPYISLLLALTLATAPWLQAFAARPAAATAYCNCCQGACHGCCCTAEQDSTAPQPTTAHNACGCDMSSSTSPKSEAPFETVKVNVEDRPTFTTVAPLLAAARPSAPQPVTAEFLAPVADESPPLYLLNTSFLI